MIIQPPYLKAKIAPSVDTSLQKDQSIVAYKRKTNKYILIPAFSATADDISGSYCVKKFFYTLDHKCSFPKIFINTGEYNWVPVLWWIDSEGEVQRRKLWHDGNLVLYCDLYANDILPLEFAIEIWNLASSLSITQSSDVELETSVLYTPSTDCFTDSATEDTYASSAGTDFIYDLETYTWSGIDGDYWTNLDAFTYFGATEFTNILSPPAAPVIAWGEEAHPPPYAASEITWTIDGDDPDYFVFYKKHNIAPVYDYKADDLYTDASHTIVYGESPTWQIPGNIRAAWSPAFYETDGLPYPLYELKIVAFKDGLASDDSNILFAAERV